MYLNKVCLSKRIVNIFTTNISQHNVRFLSQNYVFSGGQPLTGTPKNVIYERFQSLTLPPNKVLATYVWVDGSGINLRSKDRVLNEVPQCLAALPKWAFDGSSTGQAVTKVSDILLMPCALYKDPFRHGDHLLVLCETFDSDGKPTPWNHRNHCAKLLSDIDDQQPWFGIEQEYTMFDTDMWPLGWPKSRGLPSEKSKFSYCGTGAHVVGRHVVECHTRACIYSGIDLSGTNAEVMKSSWEYQVGPTLGIKAADDLWISRYILNRVAEDFGTIISYHPKPMGKHQPGNGCHHNFSVKKMREDGGMAEIERVCKLLCERHEKDINHYGLGDGTDNKKRLTGKHETSSYNSCNYAVADRAASLRIQKIVAAAGKGFFEDRRPAGDCDPYRVCAILAETCSSKK